MEIRFDETPTRYLGRRELCAVVYLDGEGFGLKLGDTQRCAKDLGAAARTLRNLATHAGMSPVKAEESAASLMAHCQKLTGWKDKPKRDRPKNRPVRYYF